MAINLGTIFCMLGADTSGLNSAEARMTSFVNNTNRGFNKVTAMAGQVKTAIAGIITYQAIKQVVMLADEYKGLNARIAQSTKSNKDYYAVQKRIVDLSAKLGVGLESQVNLYQTIARTAPELGATDKQVLRLVESLDKLSIISGASGTDMKFAMRQFGQSMASGIVRAEEFNSIIENTPEIANRIAKGMNTTVGQLRLMVLDGKVLSKDVFASLMGQTAQIDKDFAEMPRRIGQSMESLKTGAMVFLGQLDSSLGVTGGITSAIQFVANILNSDVSTTLHDVDMFAASIGDSFKLWAANLGYANNSLNQMTGWTDSLGAKMNNVIGAIADGLVKAPLNFSLSWDLAVMAVQQGFIVIETAIKMIGNQFDLVWEMVKSGALACAQFVARQFANVISGISTALQGLMGYAAEGLAFAGFEDTAASIEDMAAKMDTTGGKAMELANALDKVADKQGKRVEAIKREGKAIMEQGALEDIQLHKQAKDRLDKYADDLALLEQKKADREANYQDLKTKLDAERALQEKAYQDQIALAAKGGGAAGAKGGKGGGAGKAASEAQSHLDALAKSLSTELELENQFYAESLSALQTAEQMKLDTIIPYQEMRERLEVKHQEKLKEIAREGADQMVKIKALNAFFGIKLQETAGNMELAQQAQNFRDQIDGAAQYSKEFFALKKAMAMASALIEAPKAVLSAFAFGCEFGGPVVGAIMAGVAGAAVAVQIAGIASQQFTASKATGGNVFSNRAYKVNEQGPEMLTTGGQSFLMMGSKGGQITPNSALGGGGIGGGGNVTVIVNNNTDATATTRESDGPNGKIIEVMIKRVTDGIAGDITAGRGKVPAAIQKTYRLGRGKAS